MPIKIPSKLPARQVLQEEGVLVIEEGVVEKGMISWKTQLSREEILAVGSYIHTLRGTTPAKAKAPEGDPAPEAETVEAEEAAGSASEESAAE